MRTIRLTVRYALCMAVLVIVMHAPTSTTELLGQSLLAQQSQSTPTATTPQARSAVPAITPSPEAKAGQGLSPDLEKIGTNVRLSVGASVVVIGSALAGNDGSAREMTIAAEHGNDFELRGTTPASAAGSPVVDEAGAVVGVVTSAGEKTIARSSAALASLFPKVTSDTRPRWLASAEGSPTPKPTPKPRLVYAPAPAFPPGVSQGGVSGTGRFRLSFDPNGNVTNVQVIKSTGNPYFDQSAIKTFRQWKSAPGQGGSVTVPVTFQTR